MQGPLKTVHMDYKITISKEGCLNVIIYIITYIFFHVLVLCWIPSPHW